MDTINKNLIWDAGLLFLKTPCRTFAVTKCCILLLGWLFMALMASSLQCFCLNSNLNYLWSDVQPWKELWIIRQWSCDDEPCVQRTFSKGMHSAFGIVLLFLTYLCWVIYKSEFCSVPACLNLPNKRTYLGNLFSVSQALYEYPSSPFPRQQPRWRVSCLTS